MTYRWLFVLSITSAACSGSHGAGSAQTADQVPPVPSVSSVPGGRPSSATPGGPLTGVVSVGETTREQYCAGNGPPVSIQLGAPGSVSITGSSCTTGLATQVFQYGLCACNDAAFTGAFSIDALDSSATAPTSGLAAASVGSMTS